jgi:eukaryotic-like serine/threonine-protein kinase
MSSTVALEPETQPGQTLDDELLQAEERPDSAPQATEVSTLVNVPAGGHRGHVERGSFSHESQLVTVARCNYQFGAEVARGGLGRILYARDLRLDRAVAIKELLRPSPAGEARFLREIAATVKLQHPNIVAIHEAGRWPDGQLFYAMNFVAGKTLLDAIRESHDTPSRLMLLPKIVDVVEAMAFAHSQGVIHRDLKPVNVLVGPFGETVVIDWGLAKVIAEPNPDDTSESSIPRAGFTRTGMVVGSPPYLPPEQAEGKEVDASCDVYAVGAMLYHALAGQAPYAETPPEGQLERIRKEEPTPLGSVAPDLPKDLLAIVSKAMARDPKARYPDCKALAEELQRFTRGRLVSAYEYRAKDLLKRFLKRNLAAVMVASVAIVVIIVLGTISLVSVRSERDSARQSADFAHEQLRKANESAQEVIVNQAASRTESDPTLAVAWLKRLAHPTSRAASVTARAEEYGVARWILRGHTDSVNCVDVAKGNDRIVSGSDDHSLILWQLGSAEGRPLRRHTDRVTDCAFSPDGAWIASSSYDGHVILWHVGSGTATALASHGDVVKSVSFSPDGKYLVSSSANDKVRIWTMADQSFQEFPVKNARWPFIELREAGFLSGPHEGKARSWRLDGTFVESPKQLSEVKFASYGAMPNAVLLGTAGGQLYEWDTATDTSTLLAQFNSPISALATRATQPSYAAVATMAGDVAEVDLVHRRIEDTMRHTERVMALAVSPDQHFIASGGWDKGVRLLDTVSHDTRLLRGHTDIVSDLAFTTDGRHLITGSWDRTLRVWPLDDALHLRRRVLRGHQVGVHSVRFAPNGRYLASGGHDNTVRLWNLVDGTQHVLLGHTDHVYRVVFSPDGQWLASSSDDKTIRLWSTADRQCKRVLSGHEGDVEELAFSPDGRLLASGSEDQTARIWEVEGEGFQVLYHDHAVTQLAFHPSSKLLATGSRAGDVRVFDTLTAKQTALYDEQGGEVFAVAFSPDGRWLASSGTTGSLTLREVGSRKAVRWTTLPGARSILFSPNGRYMAVSGTTQKLWRCDMSIMTCNEFEGPQSQVRVMRFMPDSRALATASGDGNMLLWDVESSEYRVYQGHNAPVFDIDVSPDGAWIATASGDETIRLWPTVAVPSSNTLAQRLSELTSESAAEP